jgi:hypothetical protein
MSFLPALDTALQSPPDAFRRKQFPGQDRQKPKSSPDSGLEEPPTRGTTNQRNNFPPSGKKAPFLYL